MMVMYLLILRKFGLSNRACHTTKGGAPITVRHLYILKLFRIFPIMKLRHDKVGCVIQQHPHTQRVVITFLRV